MNFKEVGKYMAKRAEIVGSFGEFAALNGLGHYRGIDTIEVRYKHDLAAVRRILRAMEAGFTKFNLKVWNFFLESYIYRNLSLNSSIRLLFRKMDGECNIVF